MILHTDADHLELATATIHQARDLEIMQMQMCGGPCLDAIRRHEPVMATTPESIDERWDTVGAAIVQGHGSDEQTRLGRTSALTARTVVEQTKGVLAEQAGLSMAEALRPDPRAGPSERHVAHRHRPWDSEHRVPSAT